MSLYCLKRTYYYGTVATYTLDHKVDWDFIWKLKVPQKIKLFLWKVHLNVLYTKAFLESRSISIEDSSSCAFCEPDKETVVHIFIKCEVATSLWNQMFQWWQINPVLSFELCLKNLWNQSLQFPIKKVSIVWKVAISVYG